jgi:predicted nucleotidyltransferase
MPDRRDIPEAMALRIARALDAIEHEHGVRILLAVESGSRAWGFPSPDSDYDVRFLYVRPLKDYLSVEPLRDVIEQPIDDALDLNGWDLRKALQLLVRSNAVLIEWLSSPIRYRDSAEASLVLALARRTGDLAALAYHYDRSARRSWEEIAAVDGPVRLKTYCYALRPALALQWIRTRAEAPPMDLPSLMAGLPIPEDVRAAVASLLAQKAAAAEAATIPHAPALDAWISEALADRSPRPLTVDRAPVLSEADALFRSVLRHQD